MSTEQSGMSKLIMSNHLPSEVEASMRFMEDPSALEKSASTIFGCDYSDVQPDSKHVGIHVVGLGDFETYGANRNGDSFPKVACVKYHDTFVKHGHVYRNHVNKDPEKKLGDIVKSAYNPDMGRIELFLHVNKDTARDELHKLASDGTHAFSMACRVPNDRCNICNTLRKTAADPNQCDHVRYDLRKTARDGSLVCTHNDLPTFFDMSFVGRPADRIAWDLKTASAEGDEELDSVKLAADSGLWVPDQIMMNTKWAQEKLKLFNKLADYQERYYGFALMTPRDSSDRHMWELRKAAGYEMPDAQINELRAVEPAAALASLADNGIVMAPRTFFKYAFGLDYGELSPHMANVLAYIKQGSFAKLRKAGAYQDACTSSYFDVEPHSVLHYSVKAASTPLVSPEVVKEAAFVGSIVGQRVINNTIAGSDPKISAINTGQVKFASAELSTVEKCAEIYASYKLSAVQGIKATGQSDGHVLIALTAVQDLV